MTNPIFIIIVIVTTMIVLNIVEKFSPFLRSILDSQPMVEIFGTFIAIILSIVFVILRTNIRKIFSMDGEMDRKSKKKHK